MTYFILTIIAIPIGWVIGWYGSKISIDIYKDIYEEIDYLRSCDRLHFNYSCEDIMYVREEIQELRKRVIELERDKNNE